jgi:hypothetical protein
MSKIKSLVLRAAGFAVVGSLAIAGQAQALKSLNSQPIEVKPRLQLP